MKLSGVKDMEIEREDTSTAVKLTMHFKTPYEAILAYEDLLAAAKTGKLKLNITTGEVLEETGPERS